jgi:hypothetical protein
MEAQKKRPARLNKLMSETTAAASVADFANMSWVMGEACDRMPMPAATLMNRMLHSK